MKLLQKIVSRMNGEKFGAPEFYWWVSENLSREDAEPLLAAIDSGDEINVRRAIAEHFRRHDLYPLALAYVRAVKWLEDDPEESLAVRASCFVPLLNVKTGEEEFHEVEYEIQTDARRTSFWQLKQAYFTCLRAGMKPWRTCVLDVIFSHGTTAKVSTVQVSAADSDERQRVKDSYRQQVEYLRKNPTSGRAFSVSPRLRIDGYYIDAKGEHKELKCERYVGLQLKDSPIEYQGREYWQDKKKQAGAL